MGVGSNLLGRYGLERTVCRLFLDLFTLLRVLSGFHSGCTGSYLGARFSFRFAVESVLAGRNFSRNGPNGSVALVSWKSAGGVLFARNAFRIHRFETDPDPEEDALSFRMVSSDRVFRGGDGFGVDELGG